MANFTLKNNILLAVSVIDLLMVIFVLSRGLKNKVNLYFGLLMFFTFIWSISLFIARFFGNITLTHIFENITFIAGILIIIYILFFVINFPYKSVNLSWWQKVLIWLPFIIVCYLVAFGNFIIETNYYNNWGEYVSKYNNVQFIFYFLYLVFLSVLSLFYLVRKYLSAEGIIKLQIKLLLWALIIGMGLATYFDLVLIYFGNFEYNWLGPVFSLLVNSAVFYLIFLNRDKSFIRGK